MPRTGRIAPGGVIYHVLNRGNARQRLFHKAGDYRAFLETITDVKKVLPTRVLGFCLMPNHWHLVLWPHEDGELSRFMLRLTTSHVRRHFAHYKNEAGGHLYQGRFKNFPVQEDRHFLVLMRYVEGNALRAKLVDNAADWMWGSLRQRNDGDPMRLLEEWPIERPRDWKRLVAEPLKESAAEQVRTSLARSRPLGTAAWTERMAKTLGLGFTMRSRGRPRKAEK